MAQITSEIESGAFEMTGSQRRAPEYQARLTQLVGDAGKRLHTGRSRNDQVATDVRLWLRGEIDLIGDLLKNCRGAGRCGRAERGRDPARLHPPAGGPAVSFGHHMLAYVEMFKRDAERMADVRRRTNVTAAAGQRRWPAPPTRWTARARGANAGHGRRLPEQPGRRERPRLRHRIHRRRQPVHGAREPPVEELIIWMSQNFGFIKIADRFTTGSSIMPQKKNPDVPELARGKTNRVVGHLMGLIT